jgi:hypothetical protein
MHNFCIFHAVYCIYVHIHRASAVFIFNGKYSPISTQSPFCAGDVRHGGRQFSPAPTVPISLLHLQQQCRLPLLILIVEAHTAPLSP